MLQWMDNFNIYGTDAGRVARMLNGPYAGINSADLVVDPDPTAGGGRVLLMAHAGNGVVVRRVLSAAQITVGVAERIWLTALPGAANQRPVIMRLSDTNNYHIFALTVDPSGHICAYRNDAGNSGDDTFFTSTPTLVGTSVAPCIVANAWQHIETKVVLDAAAGSIEVRVEGVPQLVLNGIRTTSNHAGVAATAQNVAIGNDWSGPSIYFKDFMIWDGTGASNNTFMGSCTVYKCAPDADVAQNWTLSSGATAFSLINEVTPDDDTNYISAVTPPPAADKFSLQDLPATVTSVRGVMAVHRSRKTDGGDGNIQAGLIYAANTILGADRPITTAYTYWTDMFDLAPDGAAWTKAKVNALNLQLNRTL